MIGDIYNSNHYMGENDEILFVLYENTREVAIVYFYFLGGKGSILT